MPILALAWQKDCQRQTDMRLVVLDKRGSDCVIGAFDGARHVHGRLLPASNVEGEGPVRWKEVVKRHPNRWHFTDGASLFAILR